MGTYGKRSEEKARGVQGGETLIRINSMKKTTFNENGRKVNISSRNHHCAINMAPFL